MFLIQEKNANQCFLMVLETRKGDPLINQFTLKCNEN